MAKIVLRRRNGKHDRKEAEFYVPDESADFHTEHGAIPKAALAKGGRFSLGKETFTILPAGFIDVYERLARGAQIIRPKDLGLIIAETGLSKESVVLDIGAGSGYAAILLARLVKRVHSYDVERRSLDVAKKNVAEMGVTNVTVAKGDAYDDTSIAQEGDCDLFLLDVPEPWKALATAKKALKHGAFLVAYTPCITQAMQVVEALDESFLHVKTCEVLEREWKVDGQAVRPESKDFQHTAFLTFIRKA